MLGAAMSARTCTQDCLTCAPLCTLRFMADGGLDKWHKPWLPCLVMCLWRLPSSVAQHLVITSHADVSRMQDSAPATAQRTTRGVRLISVCAARLSALVADFMLLTCTVCLCRRRGRRAPCCCGPRRCDMRTLPYAQRRRAARAWPALLPGSLGQLARVSSVQTVSQGETRCSPGAPSAAAGRARPVDILVHRQHICTLGSMSAAACAKSAQTPSPMQGRQLGATQTARRRAARAG